MLTRLCLLFACILLLPSCAPKLTQEGSGIQLVDTKDNCKYISVVTGSYGNGTSTAGDAEGAMNEVRNKAAEAGGNALKVLNIDSDHMDTTVVAEALRCGS